MTPKIGDYILCPSCQNEWSRRTQYPLQCPRCRHKIYFICGVCENAYQSLKQMRECLASHR